MIIAFVSFGGLQSMASGWRVEEQVLPLLDADDLKA